MSQGAKPGKGGVLPGGKVTAEIAAIRGIPQGQDSISPNRHRDAANTTELLDQVAYIRTLTGRPVGIKTAIGGWWFLNDLAENVLRRGLEYAPDFIVIDGGEGGSGAAPQALFDHMSLSIEEALPRAADVLYESGLKERIRLVASGKLVTSARAAWALCVGADFVNTARGFMFSLGCIQALRCQTNTCPTGITTHNPRLQRGLVVEEKYLRVANYAKGMNHDIEMIAHSCGVEHPRLLRPRALPHRPGQRAFDFAQDALPVSRREVAALGVRRARDDDDGLPGAGARGGEGPGRRQRGLSDAALADAILVVHAAFVLFVVGGTGRDLDRPRAGASPSRATLVPRLHLAAIGFVVVETLLGYMCPLTIWEDALRGGASEKGFIQRWIHAWLYWNWPAWLFNAIYVAFGGLVAWTWVRFPPRRADP
jgi:hypothetical protein